MNRLPFSRKGFLQASGVTLYCSLVGLIFWKGDELFGSTPNFLGPVMGLMLLSVSALICGLLVFYQPYLLFFKGKRLAAAELVLSTTLWLVSFFVCILLAVIIV